MTLAEILARAEALAGDVELSVLRDWQDHGGKAVGCLPAYVPTELIDAAGALPVGLLGAGPALEVVQGDALFQSAICHLPRSIADLGLRGALAALDLVVMPSTCDVMRNLSGMWHMLWPGQSVFYLDLPQRFDEAGFTFYRGELHRLIVELERTLGVAIRPEALRDSVVTHNQRRQALRELAKLRVLEPWRVPTSELYLVLRAGALLRPSEHVALLRDYLAAVRMAERPMLDVARVVLWGGFCEQPPIGFLRTLERAGCAIVEDDLLLGLQWFRDDVTLTADAVDALAAAYLKQSPPAPCRFEGDARRGDVLVERARACRAAGVILASPSFCDPALLDRPALLHALGKVGIPVVQLQYAENSVDFGSVREQAGTFADTLRLWDAA